MRIFIIIHIILIVIIFYSCQSTEAESQSFNEISIPEKKEEISPLDTLGIDYLMGHFDPSSHPDFIVMDERHCDRSGLMLRKEVYEAFKEMHDAARRDSVNLVIRSATRNFDYQKGIWNRKWRERTEDKELLNFQDRLDVAMSIMRYSAMPGTSRHHWGTDIDINMFNNDYFKKGQGRTVYEWLIENAGKYGFCQVYCEKPKCGREHGYEEERWHWSYLPTATKLTERSRKLMHDTLIGGFVGSETARMINAVDHYILGINPDCE